MLVLLVIFLATAPMLQQGMDVNLPETTTQPLRVRDSPLILSVNADGEYFLGRKKVDSGELESRLEAVFEARDSKEIYLRADREAPCCEGRTVLSRAAVKSRGRACHRGAAPGYSSPEVPAFEGINFSSIPADGQVIDSSAFAKLAFPEMKSLKFEPINS